MDLRDLVNPAKAREINRIMDSLVLHIGTLIISLSHDRMPPDWRPYRHLSVSDNVRPVAEDVFEQIAEIIGMGPPETWSNLGRMIDSVLPTRARHAFKVVLD